MNDTERAAGPGQPTKRRCMMDRIDETKSLYQQIVPPPERPDPVMAARVWMATAPDSRAAAHVGDLLDEIVRRGHELEDVRVIVDRATTQCGLGAAIAEHFGADLPRTD
jgi:hypothetical protein